MHNVHLVDVNHLTPFELCNFLEQKSYNSIKQMLKTIEYYSNQLEAEPESIDHSEFMRLLALHLKDELNQMMRNDQIIIFPIIRNDKGLKPCTARKLPVDMMQKMHAKILHILEKIRAASNNYILKPNWGNNEKIFIN